MGVETAAVAAAEAPAIMIDGDRKAVDRTIEEYDRNPRTVRWGYNPGLRGVNIVNRQAGLKDPLIPVGEFWEITSFKTPEEVFTIDENKPKDEIGLQYAADAEQVQIDVLGKVGYQSVLFGVEDRAMVKAINRTLIPTLSEIRSMFEDDAPVATVCPGEDELDMGVKREHCASCHLAWIKSNACQAYMQHVAETGVKFMMRAKDGAEPDFFTVKPDIDVLEDTRRSVQTGLEVYLKHSSETWATTISEIENKARNQINLDEHLMRKDLHEFKPKDSGLNQISAFADKMSENMGNNGTSPELLSYLERMDARQEAAEKRNQDFMLKMMDKLGPAASAAPPSIPTKEVAKQAALPVAEESANTAAAEGEKGLQ